MQKRESNQSMFPRDKSGEHTAVVLDGTASGLMIRGGSSPLCYDPRGANNDVVQVGRLHWRQLSTRTLSSMQYRHDRNQHTTGLRHQT
jgi:hypothetical protein